MDKHLNFTYQNQVDDIFDYTYANSDIRSPSDVFNEISKILLSSSFIEKKTGGFVFNFSNSEVNFLLNGDRKFSKIVATNIRDNYKEYIKTQSLKFDDIKFSDLNLGFIAGKLNKILFTLDGYDLVGDAYEIFRSKWSKQEGGQFFTDQKVTKLALSIINPQLNATKKIIDLCSGTGGFLLEALKYKEGNSKKKLDKNIVGVEIDSNVSKMGNDLLNTITEDKDSNIIKNTDSLDIKRLNSVGIVYEDFEYAVTNPPFGAKANIKNLELLKNFELARSSNSALNQTKSVSAQVFPRAPDILFIEQNIKMLKPGGLLAIVVPYQVVSGPQTLFVRDWILRNTIIKAVIDLPSETFQPFTGTKTSLLVLEKRELPLLLSSNCEEYSFFVAQPKWIGHDRRGNKVYETNKDGSSSDKELSDFPEIESCYKNEYLKNKEISHKNCFKSSTNTIFGDSLLRFNAASLRKPKKTKLSNKNFDYKKIGDLCERIFYPGRFKRNYVEESTNAVPFFGGSNITQMIIKTDKWISKDDPKIEQYQVEKGWILLTRSGTTGIVSSVPEKWDGYAFSEHVIRLVPDASKISPFYLQLFLKSTRCQEEIKRNVFGSVIDEITPESIAEIEVPVPKDKGKLDQMISKVRNAEKGRQSYLENFHSSLLHIEDLLN